MQPKRNDIKRNGNFSMTPTVTTIADKYSLSLKSVYSGMQSLNSARYIVITCINSHDSYVFVQSRLTSSVTILHVYTCINVHESSRL